MNPKISGVGRKCICARKVLAAAAYAHCQVDVDDVEENVRFRLLISDDLEIWDALSAMRYFARKDGLDAPLYGSTVDEMAVVDSWLSYQEAFIMIPLVAWIQSPNLSDSCVDKIRADIVGSLETEVEPRLLHRTYLATERITLADINLALMLDHACALNQAARKKDLLLNLPNVQRWFNTIVAQDQVKPYLYDAPSVVKKEAATGVVKKPVAAETVKIPATKVTEQSAADVEDQIAAEEKARSSKPNPLDSLPPSPFILDAWKRQYSNTKELRSVAMPWFWENLDADGWSFWFMRYEKIEGENTVGFITANLLRGFVQRLDAQFRKYSFGVINVIGEPGNFDIQGVWLIRGQEIPSELKEHPSFEYHSFRKLDPSTDKALIEDYWCNDQVIGGRSIDACNVWK